MTMRSIKTLSVALYRHHFVRYLVVGGSTFILDFAILYTLHGVLNLNLAGSTSVAYWISIMYNFVLNRYWTFDSREKESLKRHITIYFGLLVANYLFTVTFVSIVGEHINYVYAKALAVIIQMTWTYYVYKKFIFVKQPASPGNSE
jgi:putative flippase GtrA